MAKMFALFVTLLLNFLSTSETRPLGGDCAVQLNIEQMCELVPDRGVGVKDIIRIYYNPVLQQCLPFSWSGIGGNANRFISIKNCYEICHPSDPGSRVVTEEPSFQLHLIKRKSKGVKTLSKNCNKKKKSDSDEDKKGHKKGDKMEPKDVMIRQFKHPMNPSKTLTIVQPVKYVVGDGKHDSDSDDDSTDSSDSTDTNKGNSDGDNDDNKDKKEAKVRTHHKKPTKLIIHKHIRHVPVYGNPPGRPPVQSQPFPYSQQYKPNPYYNFG